MKNFTQRFKSFFQVDTTLFCPFLERCLTPHNFCFNAQVTQHKAYLVFHIHNSGFNTSVRIYSISQHMYVVLGMYRGLSMVWGPGISSPTSIKHISSVPGYSNSSRGKSLHVSLSPCQSKQNEHEQTTFIKHRFLSPEPLTDKYQKQTLGLWTVQEL